MTKLQSTTDNVGGFITGGVIHLFEFAKWLSVLRWLSLRFPIFGSRSEFTPIEVLSHEFTAKRARAIDWYVTGWLTLEVTAVVIVSIFALPGWLCVLVVITSFLKILEILQVNINTVLF